MKLSSLVKKIKTIEFKIFKFFLKRFLNKELDQWERWETKTKHGPVYISISRQSDGYNYEKLE